MTTLEAALARRRALESGERWAADIGTSGLEERIWLGAGRDAQNLEVLRQRRITHILNVADDVPNFHEAEEGLTYLQLGVVDFGGDAGIMRVFDDAIAFVNGVFRSDNGRVLIHCANGSNRSSTVAIAVLMGALGMSLAQAWALVHARRAEARPLQDNRRQLLAFESSRLAPGASPTMIEGAGGVLVPAAFMPPAGSAAEPSPLMPPDGCLPTPAADDSVRAVGRRVRWKGTGGAGQPEAMGGLVWTVSGVEGSQLQVLQDIPAGCSERLLGAAADEVAVVFGHAKTADEEAVAEAALH